MSILENERKWLAVVDPTHGRHVIPLNDLREHLESNSCWCRPTLDPDPPDGLRPVYVHHSLDGRELSEPDYSDRPDLHEPVN